MSFWNLTPRDFLYEGLFTKGRLDVIIFGATGMSGRYTVLHALEVLHSYRWGIAGRDYNQLKEMLDEIGYINNIDVIDVPILIGNVGKKCGLMNMVESCRVLVNCCAPCNKVNEDIIRACIGTGTHYVDMCCEPAFIELMYKRYHRYAVESGVLIISACGFFSLPTELGIILAKKKFNGTINSIESFSEYWTTDRNMLSPIGSQSLWKSLVNALGSLSEFHTLRRENVEIQLPVLEPKLLTRPLLSESEVLKGVCLPMPFIDSAIVDRSQDYFYQIKGHRPIQFKKYVMFPSPIIALFVILWGSFLALLAQIRPTRLLLHKYPRIFSLGLFSSKGPSARQQEKAFFKITLIAKGWDKSYKNPNIHFDDEPIKKLKVKVGGVNPICGVASVCLLSSAVTVLEDRDRMPQPGGVYTPGAAFAHTRIINVITKYEHGLYFDIDDESKTKK